MGKRKPAILLDEPPEFFRKGDLFRVKIHGVAEFALSPHNLLITIERATGAYRDWQAEDHSAKPIRKR